MFERRTAITLSNILLIVATGLLLVLLWQLRSLLVILMIAVVLAAALAPVVDWADRWSIPRWLTVVGVYLALIAGLTGVGVFIGPPVVTQIERLIRQLPVYLELLRSLAENLAVRLGMTQPELLRRIFDIQGLTSWVIGSSQQFLVRSYGVTRGIIGAIFSLVLALVISGYMLAGSENLIKGLVSIFPRPWDERLAAQVDPVSNRMGSYIQGRVLVSAILGVAITLGLSFLGLSEFSLALGVIAGFTNLIPFVGPILGAVPALIVAVSQPGLTFLWVLLLFVIIQNVETYVLDPLLVGPSVKVHPLYQLLAVLGGTQVLGIVGALIVPPWVAGAAVLLENLYLKPKMLAEQQAQLVEYPQDSLSGLPNNSPTLKQ
ncbi:MAG: AI-2E family transporter [Aphanothece sp. CMT-3BRIN-NPC111]|jgi:predicted PurR-regulated permease PerM|nr:AI-2E family transporter [Aphanothece sp. CMT-3BRIN-NPC111]